MWFLKWLTGGVLDRAMSSVDKYVAAQTDRDAIKADIIKTHMQTRADWLRAGGFWTLLLFAVPTALHYGFVTFFSMVLCKGCMAPVAWTVAALPEPLDQYQGWIILASIGGLSLLGMRR